ncbi:hypothetical protein VTN96DRAFT_8107 [Rasamsonia emersonii]
MDSLVITDGYYWINASWGVSTTAGTFRYMTENGSIAQTLSLNKVMDMLRTKLLLGIGTFAISVSCGFEMSNDKIVATSDKKEFSIKCHNFFHIKKTDWHGPPQTTSVGFMASNELLTEAESLSKPAISENVLNRTGGLFTTGNVNPFLTIVSPFAGVLLSLVRFKTFSEIAGLLSDSASVRSSFDAMNPTEVVCGGPCQSVFLMWKKLWHLMLNSFLSDVATILSLLISKPQETEIANVPMPSNNLVLSMSMTLFNDNV